MNKYLENFIVRGIYVSGGFYRLYKAATVKKEKSILVLRTGAIGDMVCTTPFLRELRKCYPDYHIAIVCQPSTKNMLEACPYIDEIMIYDRTGRKHRFLKNLFRSYHFVKKNFTNRNFEIVIDPNHDSCPDSYPDSYLAWLSGANRRIAYSELISEKQHRYFMGMHDKFFSDLCHDNDVHHEVESTLGLLKYACGCVQRGG